MGMLKEFKDFALKGNVVDLAVGIVIGAAFGAIVGSLVKDIIMPLIGMAMNGIDFTKKAVTVGSANVTYGMFIQAIINFIIVAFSLFLIIKAINATKKKEVEKPAGPLAPTKEEILLTEIRDLLKNRPV